MKTMKEKIKEKALSLSSSERASLIHDLILSLEEESSYDLEPHIEEEIQHRLKKIKAGDVEGYSADSVFDEIEKKYT